MSSAVWLQNIAYQMPVELQHRACADRRLFRVSRLVDEERGWRDTPCHVCGEMLWQYPEPSYWMEYPLMNQIARLADGELVCSEWCAEVVLTRGEQLQLALE